MNRQRPGAVRWGTQPHGRQRPRTARWAAALLLVALTAVPASAQMRVDGSLFAQRFEKRPVYGPGGALHFSFYNYAFELTASGGYYVTPADTLESWDVRIDARLNLPSLSLIRPYVGVGMDRAIDEDRKRNTGVVVGGAYLGFGFGRRIHPFVEGVYRAAPALQNFRFRAGLRIQFLDP
jgi:hypothetical protein